jgi:aminomethyltransferase
VHRRRGADGGARLVSGAREQHLATRRGAGLFDFSFMGLYEFAEAAALEPLQSRVLGRMAPGRIAYTLLIGEDGRVVNDATVWRLHDGRWWLFSGRRSDAGWIAERAKPRVRSGEHAVIALQGPSSGAILARIVGEAAVRSLRYFDLAAFRAAGCAGHVGRIGYSGELGYEIVVPTGEEARVREALLDAGAGEALQECTFEAADTLRIEAGYVLFDREITGAQRPEELRLARLVERRVGPRQDARQRLVGLEIDPGPARGGGWLPAAHVTSECDSPTLGRQIGLGFVDGEAAAPGGRVVLQDGRAARVARLPFYDPARKRPRATPL